VLQRRRPPRRRVPWPRRYVDFQSSHIGQILAIFRPPLFHSCPSPAPAYPTMVSLVVLTMR
jgi:hypothetical protein